MEPLRNTALLQPWQLATLLGVFLPLTFLWGYALVDCARGGARQEAPADLHPGLSPLDTLTWAALLVMTGWFGAVVYLAVVVYPRIWPRLWRRLGSRLSSSSLGGGRRRLFAPALEG
jgi:hypothetical protein